MPDLPMHPHRILRRLRCRAYFCQRVFERTWFGLAHLHGPNHCLHTGMPCRERKAGWYSSGAYLAHKLLEEVGAAALTTLAFSCILYFPLRLHGTWALFWMVYFVTSTIGIGELLQ